MATSNYMIRKFHGIEFQQERKTSMINITPLFENAAQLIVFEKEKVNPDITGFTKNNKDKRLDHYMDLPDTIKLLNRLVEVYDLDPKEVKRVSRAKGAKGTFVHPVVFIDAMGWISVDFKIWAGALVADELVMFRNESALSNKKITAAFDQSGLITNPVCQYGTLNRAIGDACHISFTETKTKRTYKWERATKEQLALRDNIQTVIAGMAEVGAITSFSHGIEIIHKLGK